MKKIFLSIIFILAIIFAYSQNVYQKGNIIKDTITIEEVKVSGSYTAAKETPFSFQNLTQKQIEVITQNSEPAVILSTTPSVNHYSDNGLDIGYTYFRLRGIDQTRINSSLNGVNLNEPEDQGIYYNNYGNFLNSVSSIQIIRGAGVTKGSNSTYGGSINFSSPEFSDTTNSDVGVTLGSYNTYKITGGYNSKHFFINGSAAQSDRYRYYSDNQQYSVFYGAQLKCLKWYGFVGHQKNGILFLTEKDLIKSSEDKPVADLSLYDFRGDPLPTSGSKSMGEAEYVIFKSNDGRLNILKNKYPIYFNGNKHY